jgi:hypothetical protein
VAGFKSKKPRERFYLLPGQGGKNYVRKQRVILGWTILVSLVLGAALAAVLWWIANRHP